MKMVSHGTSYGIRRDTAGSKHNSFLIDSTRLRAALAREFNGRLPVVDAGPLRRAFGSSRCASLGP